MISIPKLNGWDYDYKGGEGLKLATTEFTNKCQLSCQMCYRLPSYDQFSLNLESKWNLYNELKAIGVETIKIVGSGEPLLDPDFKEQIVFIYNLGMKIIVHTNGLLLYDNPELIAFLNKYKVSIILKVNSLNPEFEDQFLNVSKGYGGIRNKVIESLIKTGFNIDTPTRLGFDTIITRINIPDVEEIYLYCLENNIFPEIKGFCPLGSSINMKDMYLTVEEQIVNFNILRKKGELVGFVDTKIGFPYSFFSCTERSYSILIRQDGNVLPCPGANINESFGKYPEQGILEILGSYDFPEEEGCPYRLNFDKLF